MKTRRGHPGAGRWGLALIECLAYLALFVIVLGLAVAAFNNCWDSSSRLRRNAEDIVRVLDAGDRWRADVRAATGSIEVSDVDGAQQIRIPAPAGEVTYIFSKGDLRRQSGSPAANTLLLSHIKSSRMQPDLRGTVSAWRWEIELNSALKKSPWLPLFTFESVAGRAINP